MLSDLFAFFRLPNTNYYVFTPGLVLMLGLFIALILWIKGRFNYIEKIITVMSIIFLIISTNLFPWNFLVPKFRIFDLLTNVQAPWRYLTSATVCLTVLFGIVLKRWDEKLVFNISDVRFRKSIYIFLTIYMLFYTSGFENFSKVYYYDTDNLNTFGISNGEFIRVGKKGSEQAGIAAQYNLFSGATFGVGLNDFKIISRKGNDFDIYIENGSDEGTLGVPILNYKNYVAFDERQKFEINDGADYCVAVSIPKNYSGTIHIRYNEPWYWTLSFFISIISFGFIIVLFIYKEKFFN